MPEGGASACLVCRAPIPTGVEACPSCRTPVPRAKTPRAASGAAPAPQQGRAFPASRGLHASPPVPSPPPAAPPAQAATPPTALSLGAVVDGKYEVRQVLGTGGFGEVYRVYHRVLRTEFALKTLHPGLLLDPSIRERFFREARILMGLIHTNLVPLREVGEWEGLLYLTMDLCPGETLSSLLKRRARLSARQAARLALPVLGALEHAHDKGIVHRDLKPANLIVSEVDGGRWEVKVLDFGVAKILHEGGAMDEDGQSLTATGAMVGTLAYMSPEQAQGLEIDARSDLFSMGAVLYQAVTGRRPFEGRNPREIAMKILLHAAPPFEQAGATDADLPGLEALVVRCLAKDPADRPASARDLRHELQRLLDGGQRSDSGSVEPLSATIDRATGPTVPDAKAAEPEPEPARRTEPFPPTADRATGPTVDAPQSKSRPTAAPVSGGGNSRPATGRADAVTSPSQATAVDGAPRSVETAPPARAGLGRAGALAAAVLVAVAGLAWQLGWFPDRSGAAHTGAAGPASPPTGAAPTKSAGAGPAPLSPSADLKAAKRAHDEAIAEAREKVQLSDWQGAEVAVNRARGFRVDSEDAAAVESAIRTGRANAAFASVKAKALAAIFAEPAAEAHPYRTAIELVRTFAEGPDAGASAQAAREFLATLELQEAESVRKGHEKVLAEAREKRPAHERSGAATAAARALEFVPGSTEAEGLLGKLKLDQAREALEAVKSKARAALPTGEPAPGPHPYRAAVTLARAFAEGEDAEPVRQEARAFVKSLEGQEVAAVRAGLDSALADARARMKDREWTKAQAAVGRALAFDPSSTEASRVQGELAAAKEAPERPAPSGTCPAPLAFPGCRATGRNAQGREEYLHEKTGIVMVLIPAGEFKMGSPTGESGRDGLGQEKLHAVRISRPFLLSKYEVTQAQWQSVMGSNPSAFPAAGTKAPVEGVSWEDCKEFCRKTGLSLPTEAQWEYACRAGTTTPFHFGTTIPTDQVNYNGNYPYDNAPKGNYRATTVAVGSFPANAWGLHDMHGNVWEWCEDVFDAGYYARSPAIDPLCDSASLNRVVRGGSWNCGAGNCRSAERFCRSADGIDSAGRGGLNPGDRYGDVGFRPSKPLP
ncbi:MAG: SUMF1/EgtB/PvdO family nonheme iron enzyme [Planctomycetes bacterium]|nr:SUMF1/EgtB/PvdO family nonheme iron enzyme [Planctomycetota bacterium]